MNKDRRKQITEIIGKIDDLKDKLQNVLDEEQMAFDNMPENLQYSMRGEESEDAINALEEALDLFDDIANVLDNI